MNTTERFHRVMEFKEVDRLPVMEWADWWFLLGAYQWFMRWSFEFYPEMWPTVRPEDTVEAMHEEITQLIKDLKNDNNT